MSITKIGPYKIVEEEVTNVNVMNVQLVTMLFDLSEDMELTTDLSNRIQSSFQDADKVSFIAAYRDQITPQSYIGLAMVKWLTPDSDDENLDPSDYCFPLFVAHKHVGEASVTEIIENYILTKAQSQQYLQETTKELFGE